MRIRVARHCLATGIGNSRLVSRSSALHGPIGPPPSRVGATGPAGTGSAASGACSASRRARATAPGGFAGCDGCVTPQSALRRSARRYYFSSSQGSQPSAIDNAASVRNVGDLCSRSNFDRCPRSTPAKSASLLMLRSFFFARSKTCRLNTARRSASVRFTSLSCLGTQRRLVYFFVRCAAFRQHLRVAALQGLSTCQGGCSQRGEARRSASSYVRAERRSRFGSNRITRRRSKAAAILASVEARKSFLPRRKWDSVALFRSFSQQNCSTVEYDSRMSDSTCLRIVASTSVSGRCTSNQLPLGLRSRICDRKPQHQRDPARGVTNARRTSMRGLEARVVCGTAAMIGAMSCAVVLHETETTTSKVKGPKDTTGMPMSAVVLPNALLDVEDNGLILRLAGDPTCVRRTVHSGPVLLEQRGALTERGRSYRNTEAGLALAGGVAAALGAASGGSTASSTNGSGDSPSFTKSQRQLALAGGLSALVGAGIGWIVDTLRPGTLREQQTSERWTENIDEDVACQPGAVPPLTFNLDGVSHVFVDGKTKTSAKAWLGVFEKAAGREVKLRFGTGTTSPVQVTPKAAWYLDQVTIDVDGNATVYPPVELDPITKSDAVATCGEENILLLSAEAKRLGNVLTLHREAGSVVGTPKVQLYAMPAKGAGSVAMRLPNTPNRQIHLILVSPAEFRTHVEGDVQVLDEPKLVGAFDNTSAYHVRSLLLTGVSSSGPAVFELQAVGRGCIYVFSYYDIPG